MILEMMLRPTIQKMLPDVLAEFKETQTDFAELHLKNKTVKMGCKCNGKILIERPMTDFDEMVKQGKDEFEKLKGTMIGKMMDGIDVDEKLANDVFESMFIDMGLTHTTVIVKSEILGKLQLKFKNEKICPTK